MQTADVSLAGNRGSIELIRTIRGNSVAGEIASDLGPFGFRGSHNYNLSLTTGEASAATRSVPSMPPAPATSHRVTASAR